MSRSLAAALLAVTAAALAAQPLPGAAKAPAPVSAKQKPTPSAAARRGLAFAEQRCSGCHAVTANQASPNPESPSFEDVANRPGVTSATLQQFLRDSHNYPAAMNFRVEAARIRDLAVYIETLKKPGYRPLM